MTAEVLYPSKIAVIDRSQFLSFLTRHPDAYQAVTEVLSLQYKVACEQLRTVGLSASAPEKLARLLLDISEHGQKTATGTRCTFALTHGEIGEFIGVSRETVTRTLSAFKSRRLVSLHGSTLMIPSRMALESLADV
jgi:CRP/FNR family transcriptional regulator, cyclic AMP receptor protein